MGGTFGIAGKMALQEVSKTTGTRQTAGLPTFHTASEPLPKIPKVAAGSSVLSTGGEENGSIYFLPYRYYLSSDEMVFSEQSGWDQHERYKEFIQVIRQKMLVDYPWNETAIICEIFHQDMSLMYWEKAVQEISSPEKRFSLRDKAYSETLYHTCSKKLHQAKQNFYLRKTQMPPADFSSKALWFGSFSNLDLNNNLTPKEHIGSIYFDGGRIRLIHQYGSTIEHIQMKRTLLAERGQEILHKEDDVLNLAQRVAAARKKVKRGETLYEYNYDYGLRHTSRGYPKKIVLNNYEIAQLYYTIERMDEVQYSGKYNKNLVISASNHLLEQFLHINSRLRRELGY